MRSLLILPLLALAGPALAGPLDERLAAAEPCRNLPQINVTESVTMERASITVLPETADLTMAGHIACRSAPGSLMAGDASARVEAQVRLDLATCEAVETDVTLSEFGGSLGPLVEALGPDLAAALEKEIGRQARRSCRDLLD